MKLEKYLNEKQKEMPMSMAGLTKKKGKDETYYVTMTVRFNIKADNDNKAEKIAEKYCKTIKTKGKDKVTDIDFEYSESLP